MFSRWPRPSLRLSLNLTLRGPTARSGSLVFWELCPTCLTRPTVKPSARTEDRRLFPPGNPRHRKRNSLPLFAFAYAPLLPGGISLSPLPREGPRCYKGPSSSVETSASPSQRARVLQKRAPLPAKARPDPPLEPAVTPRNLGPLATSIASFLDFARFATPAA